MTGLRKSFFYRKPSGFEYDVNLKSKPSSLDLNNGIEDEEIEMINYEEEF